MDTINEKIALQEDDFLSKLHKIVNETILEEDLIINNLLHPPKEILSQGQKLSDRIARFGGSWKFIIFFSRNHRYLDRLQRHRHWKKRI
jgi:uncharacterized membrane protein